jgi:hypothetical protein
MHKALRVAAPVRVWVEQQPEGRVHSVFAKACNLAWGDEWISLVLPEYGMVPGGIAVALTGEGGWGFRPGEAVRWDAARQCLFSTGSGTGIDFAGAPLWANRGRVASVAPAPVRHARLASLAGVVRADGRGELARAFSGWPPTFPADRDPLQWCSYAWEPMQAMLHALTTGDADGVAEAVRPLVGLGEGLTPSGDDFLVGLLAALHYGGNGLRSMQVACRLRLGAEAAKLGARATTPVSANYLRQAAGGSFSERLETVAVALLSEEGGDYAAAARLLIDTGHSSGTDSLVGLMLGTTVIQVG